MKEFNLFLLLAFSIVFFSCRKDKICLETDNCSITEAYFPLAVGNYWVYQVSTYDYTTYIGSVFEDMDTIRIVGDTSIRAHTYFAVEKVTYLSSMAFRDTVFYRDSSEYIVNARGDIQFSAVDFDNILHVWEPSPYHRIEFAVKDSIINQLTPVGLFGCLDFNGCPFFNGEKMENSFRNYYAKDIGLVYQTQFYASAPSSEIRFSLYDYYLVD